MRINFRSGFYAGVIVAVAVGIYLFQLWQPDRQVELHSLHFLHAIEQKNWGAIGEAVDATYEDQWQHDRGLLLARMRAVLGYTRNLQLTSHESLVVPTQSGPEWRARITVSGGDDELMTLIKQRVNPLPAPFRLQWRQQSWKPWEWKLVRASNDALALPEGAGL